jgi:ADP-ribose pyrophosphatase YjhB (NUDIX family)
LLASWAAVTDEAFVSPGEDLHYCPRCGAPLIVRLLPSEDRPRLVCDRGHILYVNPKLVVGVIPERRGKVLLMRRAIEPRHGFWTFPGGFLEVDESVEECAAREAKEETGADVRVDRVLGVYSRPAIGIVSIVYCGHVASAKLDPGREALEARWFDPEDIPWDDLAYDTTRWALRDWVEQRSKGQGARGKRGGR